MTAPGRTGGAGGPAVRDGSLVHGDGSRTALRDELLIGRAPHCGVRLGDSSVSREHALIRRGASHWTVCDQGSRNGTALNGSQLPMYVACPLRDGDRLGVGRVRLTVELVNAEDPDATSGVLLTEIAAVDTLSPYQLQVVRCLAEPWISGGEPATNAEIAQALGTPLAVDAVKAALRRAYLKTGLADQPIHTKRRALCRIAQNRRWL